MPISKRMFLAASTLALAVALTACSSQPKRWKKAGADKETRWLDVNECGNYARAEMNSRDLLREERFHGRAIALEQNYRNNDVAGLQRMAEADYLRSRQRIFEDCMALKGYRPSQAKPAKDG